MKKTICFLLVILLISNCTPRYKNNSDKKISPYKIIYKQALFIDNDTFFRAIVVFQKEAFVNLHMYLPVNESAIQISLLNNLIYSEYYLPYLKNRCELDTITTLNTRAITRVKLGVYVGKLDLYKYKEKWKNKVKIKDFKFGENQYGRRIKIAPLKD